MREEVDYSNVNEKIDTATVFPSPQAPMAVARQLYRQYEHPAGRTLMNWRGEWMRWTGPHWVELEHSELRGRVYDLLEHAEYAYTDKKTLITEMAPWNPNRHKVADVMEAMRGISHLSSAVDAPQWLVQAVQADSETNALPADEIVSCANGLLHVPARKLIDHTPAFFTRVSVPFDYLPDAPEPHAWLEFLASVWGDDADAIAALQEFFGYVLSGRTDMQKILLLIGPTRSGKGTIARVLTALVGKGNAAGPTLASLGTNFGLSPLLGKPLAVVSDARLGGTNVYQVVERLLSISGEDMLTVDRKFKDPWSGKLPSRLVILSNELPRSGDASGAIANRFIVLLMTASFLGKEDRTLTGKLLAELPGILSWSLDGLDRLMSAGAFSTPQSSRDAITLLQDLVSPISAFVRNECVQAPMHVIAKSDLYEAWKTWCAENGHHATASSTFGRDLKSVIPTLGGLRGRTGNGIRFWSYTGIRLRTEADEEPSNGADNGEHPGPPGPQRETAGQGAAGGAGRPGPRPGAKSGGPGPSWTTAPAKPQVTASGPGGPRSSPLRAVIETDQAPPTCPVCGTAHADPTERDYAICRGCLAAHGFPSECAAGCGVPLPRKYKFVMHHDCARKRDAA